MGSDPAQNIASNALQPASPANESKCNTSAELTAQEQRILLQSLEFVERRVFERVTGRMKVYLLFVVALLTVFGTVTLTNLKSAISDLTVHKLATDSHIRESVEKEAAERIARATELVKRSQKMAEELDKESARVNTTLFHDLEQIHKMLGQLKEDLAKLEKKVPSLEKQ